jgi:hypothetical protein
MNKPQTPVRSMTLEPPAKSAIKKARLLAGCTIREAAIAVYVPTNYWRDAEQGKVKMHPAVAELFALKMLKDKVSS